MKVVEIVTECEHGKTDPHRWDPSTTISDEGWCSGGSRRVLAPGEYVLVFGAFQRAVASAADFEEAVNAAAVVMGEDPRRLGPSGFTVCGECEDGWVYPAPHGVDATDCPAFYDICRCEGTPCPSCRGSGLVPTDELRQAAVDAARSMWGLPCRPADLADAVLRVVTEHLGEAATPRKEAPSE